MSFSASALQVMLDKGLSLADVVEIAAANERRADSTNAQRQARHRAKKKAESNGVTVTRYGVSNDKDILTFPSPPKVVSNETTPPTEDQVLEAFNSMAAECGLPKAKMTDERRRKVRVLMRRNSVDDITEAIWSIPQLPFLCGQNDRGWRADFDFFLQPKSFDRLREGSYGGQSVSR